MGTAALAMLAAAVARGRTSICRAEPSCRVGPHFAPKAKQVIYLHMVGGPPQMDLYDYKPADGRVFTIRICPNPFAWASG